VLDRGVRDRSIERKDTGQRNDDYGSDPRLGLNRIRAELPLPKAAGY
jgi:hypothetical protein